MNLLMEFLINSLQKRQNILESAFCEWLRWTSLFLLFIFFNHCLFSVTYFISKQISLSFLFLFFIPFTTFF